MLALRLGDCVEEHPSPEELHRFVEGSLPRDEARRVVAHFLDGCKSCGDEAVRYNLQRLSSAERAPASCVGYPPAMVQALLR